MTTIADLKAKLTATLVGETLPTGYEDILGKITVNEDNVTTDDDNTFSDIEIQQLIEALNTHAAGNPADAETIYQITHALSKKLHEKSDAIGTYDDNYGFGADYDGRAEMARQLSDKIDSDTAYQDWIREYFDGSRQTEATAFIQSLSTTDQIKMLEYLANNSSDASNGTDNTTALNNALSYLSETQKSHILAEITPTSPLCAKLDDATKANALVAALPTADPPSKTDYDEFNKIFNNLGDVSARQTVIKKLNEVGKLDNKMALALMNAAYADDTGTNTHSVSDIDIVMTQLKDLGKLTGLKGTDTTTKYYFDSNYNSDYARKVSEQKSDLINLLKANDFAEADDIEMNVADAPHLKAFTDFLATLPITPAGGTDQTDPTESINTYFETNTADKEEILDLIASGDLVINSSDMAFFWDYLREQGETVQTDFLKRIDPYSPVHLSLMQTLADHKSDLDADDEDEDDLSSGEKKYWEALQDLSDAIGTGEGDVSDVDLDCIFPKKDDDDDVTTSDVIDGIFGNVSDTTDSSANSLHLSDFMVQINKKKYDVSDIEAFVKAIPEDEVSEFSGALFSDESPLLSIIQSEDDEDALKKVFENLFTVLSGSNITHIQRMEFLKGINPDSEFFSYLESMGYVGITDIIEEIHNDDSKDTDKDTAKDTDSTNDYSEYDTDMIQSFFENDMKKVTKIWYGASVSTDYIDDLTGAADEKEMKKILEDAEDAGVLESVLYSISADSFEGGSSAFYNLFFKTLDKNNNYSEIFMNAISPNSNLGRTFVSLSDNKTPPFDKISYEVDTDTGNLDFGGSENKLLKLLSDSKLVGADVFYDTFSTIQSEYENAVGTDNGGIRKLQDEALKKNLSNETLDEIFNITYDADGNPELDDAEEMLEIIADDESILFKSLGNAELSHFIEKFLSWIASKDSDDASLLEAFCENLDEDSLFYKAIIKGGGDAQDFEDGEYRNFINSVGQSNDVAKFVKDYQKFSSDNTDAGSLDFVTQMLQGAKGSSKIDDAVDDILDFAIADGQAMEDLITDIASGGAIITSLEKEQAKTLVEEIFAYILSSKPEEDEDISEEALLFIDNISEGSAIYTLIQKEYPAIAGYLGATVTPTASRTTKQNDTQEYDDKDIASEMKKLLNNKQLVNNYLTQATGTNDTQSGDSSSENDDLYMPTDESTDSTQSRTGDTGVFASDDMDSATDAALKALGNSFDMSGEPDFEKNVLSSYFFEKNSVKDLAVAAYNDKFDTKQVIGTLQLIPLDKQPDFIREYMANSNIDAETKDFLLGRLLIMTVNKEVGERTVQSILEDANISELNTDNVTEIMDNWADVMSKHTDVSITSIDDTYEKVIEATAKLEPSDKTANTTGQTNPQTGQQPYSPYGQYPYGGGMYGGMGGMMGGMGGMYGGMYGGMMGGMYGGMMGGMGSMYAMGSMYGMNPMMGMSSYYSAGLTAGTQMATGGTYSSIGTPPSKDNIVINASDTFKGSVDLNISPDGSVNINATPTAQTTKPAKKDNIE